MDLIVLVRPDRLLHPRRTLVQLASFVRDRLTDVAAWSRHGTADAVALREQAATAVVTAAAPFAPNSYARARLLRQLHATGLLDAQEVARTEQLFEIAQ